MLAIPIYQWRNIGDSLNYWRWYPTGIIQLKKKDNQVGFSALIRTMYLLN